jgi:hypothetical protein
VSTPLSEVIPGFLYVAGECNAEYMEVTEKKHGFRHFSHVCSLRGRQHASVFPHTVSALAIAVGDAHQQDFTPFQRHFDAILTLL